MMNAEAIDDDGFLDVEDSMMFQSDESNDDNSAKEATNAAESNNDTTNDIDGYSTSINNRIGEFKEKYTVIMNKLFSAIKEEITLISIVALLFFGAGVYMYFFGSIEDRVPSQESVDASLNNGFSSPSYETQTVSSFANTSRSDDKPSSGFFNDTEHSSTLTTVLPNKTKIHIDGKFLTLEEFRTYQNQAKEDLESEISMTQMAIATNSQAIEELKENSRKLDSIATITNMVEEQNRKIASLTEKLGLYDSKLNQLEKNDGWFDNRIKRIESRSVTTRRANKVSSSRSTRSASGISRWNIRGMTDDRAFIINTVDGSRMKVFVNTHIPGIGKVIAFEPSRKRIKTTQGYVD